MQRHRRVRGDRVKLGPGVLDQAINIERIEVAGDDRESKWTLRGARFGH